MLPEHDSESIATEGALGALADAGLEPGDVDAVVGIQSQELALTLGLGPCTRIANAFGIPAVLQAAQMVAAGQSRGRPDRGGRSRRLHRPERHGSVDEAGQRVRRRVRALHRRRVRPHGAATHDRVRHHTRADGCRGCDGPEQRARQPRRRVHRSRSVHSRRHFRVADGRGPVPPPRVRHDVRGRLRARPGPSRRRRPSAPAACLRARG